MAEDGSTGTAELVALVPLSDHEDLVEALLAADDVAQPSMTAAEVAAIVGAVATVNLTVATLAGTTAAAVDAAAAVGAARVGASDADASNASGVAESRV